MEEKIAAVGGEDGWYQDPEDRLLLPEDLEKHLLLYMHQTVILENSKMLTLLETVGLWFRQRTTTCKLVERCQACQDMKPGKVNNEHTGRRVEARKLFGSRFHRGYTR